jgi:hypothetical protein
MTVSGVSERTVGQRLGNVAKRQLTLIALSANARNFGGIGDEFARFQLVFSWSYTEMRIDEYGEPIWHDTRKKEREELSETGGPYHRRPGD